MSNKILLAAALWIGFSNAAFAAGRSWNWIWISPTADASSKSLFWTEQGVATDNLAGRSFDIHIGGRGGQADLVLYDLKGTIRGKTVTALLTDLEADETPTHYAGSFVTKTVSDRISLNGPDGTAILLYTPAEKSN